MIYTILIVVIAIIGVLMATVVLLQSGKGGGLAGIAGGGGGGATQLLGARQAPDILEKATWILATIFITLCILTNFFVDPVESRESILQSQGQQLPVQAPAATPPAAAPATPDE
jgi:preprotein translocase subunit SecG